MGRIVRGHLGDVRGKVGNLIVTEAFGAPVAKGLPRSSSKPPSQKQLEQRQKMFVSGKFLRKIKKVVLLGFGNEAHRMNGFNLASKLLIKWALRGQYPDYSIDYSLVTVSQGELPSLFAPATVSTVKDTITFTWNATEVVNTKPDDKAILVSYCPEFNVSVYTLSGPDRSAGTGTLVMPGLSGRQVHSWMTFISADGKEISDSQYAGTVTLV
jgi:hypothetical protein